MEFSFENFTLNELCKTQLVLDGFSNQTMVTRLKNKPDSEEAKNFNGNNHENNNQSYSAEKSRRVAIQSQHPFMEMPLQETLKEFEFARIIFSIHYIKSYVPKNRNGDALGPENYFFKLFFAPF